MQLIRAVWCAPIATRRRMGKNRTEEELWVGAAMRGAKRLRFVSCQPAHVKNSRLPPEQIRFSGSKTEISHIHTLHV
jgi:hypothetical protein